MLRPLLAAVPALFLAVSALAQAPVPLSAPVPQEPTARSAEPAPEPPAADRPAETIRPAEPVAPAPPISTPVAAPPAPAPVAAPEPAGAPAAVVADLPSWAVATLILLGAFLAAVFGMLAALMMRASEAKARRRSVAATLAVELDTRRQAFESVPLPPNVEAGVFFVSAVTSLSAIDAGFRSAQGNMHLLPGKLGAHVSVHYAAVQRVADFVKGQSLAAAVRMLQANRIGGYPCPDAGTMREAHVELGAAFRGIEKLIQNLRDLA
ncbi:MAG: hypothetical protein ACM33T_09145 [Solirubrobacterales bacterium]